MQRARERPRDGGVGINVSLRFSIVRDNVYLTLVQTVPSLRILSEEIHILLYLILHNTSVLKFIRPYLLIHINHLNPDNFSTYNALNDYIL